MQRQVLRVAVICAAMVVGGTVIGPAEGEHGPALVTGVDIGKQADEPTAAGPCYFINGMWYCFD